jgi:hypothetical protein
VAAAGGGGGGVETEEAPPPPQPVATSARVKAENLRRTFNQEGSKGSPFISTTCIFEAKFNSLWDRRCASPTARIPNTITHTVQRIPVFSRLRCAADDDDLLNLILDSRPKVCSHVENRFPARDPETCAGSQSAKEVKTHE